MQFRPPPEPDWGPPEPEPDPLNSHVQQPFPEWQQQPSSLQPGQNQQPQLDQTLVPSTPQPQWQTPPETYTPPTQIPLSPLPPPRNQVRRNRRLAVVLVLIMAVIVALFILGAFALSSTSGIPTLSPADQVATATDVAANSDATLDRNRANPVAVCIKDAEASLVASASYVRCADLRCEPTCTNRVATHASTGHSPTIMTGITVQ
jgi:hypothetical protein